MSKPLVLCILDGMGIGREKSHNAVAMARMPFFKGLFKKYPNTSLNASGPAVGLPPRTVGNSEVGHITIGSGRVVNQFLRRFQLEDWGKNKPLRKFTNDIKKSGGVVHLVGMMSDRGVHSDINNTIKIARYVLAAGLHICIHVISDGRDTIPKIASKYINQLKREFKAELVSGAVWFGTLIGRYYAMDRDHNLERTQLASNAIAKGQAPYSVDDIDEALRAAYARGETDEFIKPTIITSHVSRITSRDGILFANHRSDRARQILRMLIKTGAHMLCFAQYGEGLDNLSALLPDIHEKNSLGDVLAKYGLTQLRIAETEKYNHVTYFFDAERTIDYAGEEKVLIPSPAVATFDMKPELSSREITDALLPRLSKFDVVILNYANGDLLGHTENLAAAVKSLEFLDAQLARFVPKVLELGGTVLITADHGNIEKMWDARAGAPWKGHTTAKVPFIVVSDVKHYVKSGGLADIAPTMLKLLGIKKPAEMTGKSLI